MAQLSVLFFQLALTLSLTSIKVQVSRGCRHGLKDLIYSVRGKAKVTVLLTDTEIALRLQRQMKAIMQIIWLFIYTPLHYIFRRLQQHIHINGLYAVWLWFYFTQDAQGFNSLFYAVCFLKFFVCLYLFSNAVRMFCEFRRVLCGL